MGQGDRTDPEGRARQKFTAAREGGSIDIEKLVGNKELLAEIRQDGKFAIRTRCRELADAIFAHPCRLFGRDRALVNELPGTRRLSASWSELSPRASALRTRRARWPAWFRMNSLFMSTSDCMAEVLGALRSQLTAIVGKSNVASSDTGFDRRA